MRPRLDRPKPSEPGANLREIISLRQSSGRQIGLVSSDSLVGPQGLKVVAALHGPTTMRHPRSLSPSPLSPQRDWARSNAGGSFQGRNNRRFSFFFISSCGVFWRTYGVPRCRRLTKSRALPNLHYLSIHRRDAVDCSVRAQQQLWLSSVCSTEPSCSKPD